MKHPSNCLNQFWNFQRIARKATSLTVEENVQFSRCSRLYVCCERPLKTNWIHLNGKQIVFTRRRFCHSASLYSIRVCVRVSVFVWEHCFQVCVRVQKPKRKQRISANVHVKNICLVALSTLNRTLATRCCEQHSTFSTERRKFTLAVVFIISQFKAKQSLSLGSRFIFPLCCVRVCCVRFGDSAASEWVVNWKSHSPHLHYRHGGAHTHTHAHTLPNDSLVVHCYLRLTEIALINK